jgi:hypothetical protein
VRSAGTKTSTQLVFGEKFASADFQAKATQSANFMTKTSCLKQNDKAKT